MEYSGTVTSGFNTSVARRLVRHLFYPIVSALSHGADEPTSRRADEPTSRRADEPTSRRADEPASRQADKLTKYIRFLFFKGLIRLLSHCAGKAHNVLPTPFYKSLVLNQRPADPLEETLPQEPPPPVFCCR